MDQFNESIAGQQPLDNHDDHSHLSSATTVITTHIKPEESGKKYEMAHIDRCTSFLSMMDLLAKMPMEAKAIDFRTLREEIQDIVNRAKRVKFDLSPFEPIFMSKILNAIPTDFVTSFRYMLQTNGASFSDLREFLLRNEEMLVNGVTIRPPAPTSEAAKRTKKEAVAQTTATLPKTARSYASTEGQSRPTTRTSANDGQKPGPSRRRDSDQGNIGAAKRKEKKKGKLRCYYCTSDVHKMIHCESFAQLPLRSKTLYTNIYRICDNCLDGMHPISECKKQGCDKCTDKHNRLMCPLLNAQPR